MKTGSLVRTLAAELKADLQSGNNQQMLHLHYQPKVDYWGVVTGAETLLRCTHPTYGHISPVVILRICDEAEFSRELGQWIMNQSLDALQQFHQSGCPGLTLSFNLSPRQLREDNDLIPSLQAAIKRTGIDPQTIELELTENAAIDSSDETRMKLEQIREIGLNLSIDDFGMGHSSLSYLSDSYANVIKIDKSLVQSILTDSQRLHIVTSILALCRKLNVIAVAEGVETKKQAEKLHELGCQFFQGYYFSRPLSDKDFMEYIRKHGCLSK